MTEKKKVVVAMSGGVDSTLTAKLLLEAGYEVCGATMHQFDGQEKEIEGARAMADFLGIPFQVVDVREAYQKFVLRYFIDAYAKGMTPNPCMMCDFKVKFGLFYDEARKHFDAPYFATGHYARILFNPERQKYEVHKGIDMGKDQSYMMYHLTQDPLAHIIFPLGRTFKKDTRRISKEKGLPTYNKAESQDICFLTSETSYVEFLKNHAPEAFSEGDIVDTKGRVLGRHRGIPYYTIGQRKGLGISAPHPLYVCGICPEQNTVTLGGSQDLFSRRLTATDVNLISCDSLEKPVRVQAKIRYRHPEQPATAWCTPDGVLHVEFDEPQRAITCGQAVVLYDGETVVGGGRISSAEKS